MSPDSIESYLSGSRLFGDDFDLSQITQWYKDEEQAYFNLSPNAYSYGYYGLNDYYGYSTLADGPIPVCLAFGCADGSDVQPLAERVGRYIALEPAEKWWRSEIGGKPAQYVKPEIAGNIPLEEETVDLVACFGALHHIPNVSFVISEIHRVLKHGGVLLLREPIFSMGDWRTKRKGLTPRERGIPYSILIQTLNNAGFSIKSVSPCMVPLTPRLARLLGIKHAFNSAPLLRIDRFLSWMLSWNITYHRTSIVRKLAPTSLFIVASKDA
jgi:SAM-dependent methyltransferase